MNMYLFFPCNISLNNFKYGCVSVSVKTSCPLNENEIFRTCK